MMKAIFHVHVISFSFSSIHMYRATTGTVDSNVRFDENKKGFNVWRPYVTGTH